MPEDEKKEEKTQQTPETQETQQTQETHNNGAPTAEDLATIKAELEEEKKAIADAQALLNQRDVRIAELEAALSEAKKGSEAVTAELTQLKDAHSKAVVKYLGVVKAANPTIPGDVIAGGSIEEIDASVAKALSITESVKKALEAQAKEAKVPAGAPIRGEISLEGLSPREKIAAGIQQKGGTI